MKFRIARKINYLNKARHRRGHGIHSPNLFRLITNVIENKQRLSAYKVLRDQQDRLSHLIKRYNAELGIQTFSDSILNSSRRKNLFKAVELPIRYGKLLYRLVNEFKPKSISCYGPSFGLNLLYLALSNESITVNFFQSDNFLRRICEETFKDAGVRNVKYCDHEYLPDEIADFVFVNFPYSPVEAEKSIQAQMDSHGENDVLIVRGIHESERMETIWMETIKSGSVKVSLDLFEIGIILFSENLQKEHFILRF